MRFREVIGLDMGPGEVKAVHMRRRGPLLLQLRSERMRLPAEAADGDVMLRRFVEKNGWSGLPCVLGLTGDRLLLRLLTLGTDERRSATEVVREYLDSFRSMATGETVEDYTLTRGKDGVRHVLLGVTRMEAERARIEYVERAGLRVVDVMPGPVAMYNALRRYFGWSAAPLVGVDAGPEGTDVLIGHGSGILFTRRFDVGSFSGENEDLCKRWLNELQSCLKLYTHEKTGALYRPRHLVLCGGPFGPNDLCARVERMTGLRTLRVEHLRSARRVFQAGLFCTARGLAMAGLGSRRVTLSLLPPLLREQLVLRWQFKYWLGSGLAAVAALLMVIFSLRRDRAYTQQRFEERREQLATLRQQAAVIESYTERNRLLSEQLAPLKSSVRNANIMRLVLHAVAEAKHPNDWIVLLADAHSYFGSGSRLVRDETGAVEQEMLNSDSLHVHVVVMEGYTPVEDLSTVRAMIEALRRRPFIAGADLLGDDKLAANVERDLRWAPLEGRLFAVEIKIAE